jgi:hypothetical protein
MKEEGSEKHRSDWTFEDVGLQLRAVVVLVELELGLAQRPVAARKIGQRMRSGKPDQRSRGEEESGTLPVRSPWRLTARQPEDSPFGVRREGY